MRNAGLLRRAELQTRGRFAKVELPVVGYRIPTALASLYDFKTAVRDRVCIASAQATGEYQSEDFQTLVPERLRRYQVVHPNKCIYR